MKLEARPDPYEKTPIRLPSRALGSTKDSKLATPPQTLAQYMLPHIVATWVAGWTRSWNFFLVKVMKVFSTTLSVSDFP